MNDSDLKTAFSQTAPAALLKRKRPAPLSIRLTDEEKAVLKREAGGGSVHALARARLLGNHSRPVAPTKGGVKIDHAALAKILAMLGQSRLSSNVNQIAKAANGGRLDVSPELERKLTSACGDIRAMRITLSAALGIKVKD